MAVEVYENVVSEDQRKILLDYFNTTDDLVDSRPDVRSKTPVWNQTINWPQDTLKQILDKIIKIKNSKSVQILLSTGPLQSAGACNFSLAISSSSLFIFFFFLAMPFPNNLVYNANANLFFSKKVSIVTKLCTCYRKRPNNGRKFENRFFDIFLQVIKIRVSYLLINRIPHIPKKE